MGKAFGHPHAEIARILDVTEANCQQLHRRAKQHLATGRVRVAADADAAEKVVEEFLAAAFSGDTEPLVTLLTEDAVSVADGGGHVPARGTPILGALRIARFLRGLFRTTSGSPSSTPTRTSSNGSATTSWPPARSCGTAR